MNGWIEWFNTTSDAWSDRFWRATWQGAIVIAVAWLLTTLLYRLSPRVRSWIWRLAYVKLLLLLFWTTPIELALLPAGGRSQPEQPGIRSQGKREGEKASASANATRVIRTESAKDVEKPAVASITPLVGPQGVPHDQDERQKFSSAAPGGLQKASFRRQSYFLVIWLLGFIVVIVLLAADVWRVAKLLCNSQPLRDEHWQALSDEVCHRLGLRRGIRLRSSISACSPVLIRFFCPAIILPQAMLELSPPFSTEGRGEREGISQNHVALAIAHEAAHLRRHDLAWNALAAVVHVALYFHPLVWLAHRRIRLEQEMACDELVLEKLSAAPQDYGRMLVNVVRRLAIV